jgi:hypothetical protein
MVRRRKPTGQDLLRLDAIARHLGIKSRYQEPTFTADVTAACLARIAPVVDKLLPCTGEQIALALGEHLSLTFEEVHGPADVVELEDRYLRGMKEIGFAQLRGELEQPGVDALLFQRMHAGPRDSDRWVAVLNLQETRAKAYWNRFHEMIHRIGEPPQRILPFRRHQFEAANPVEALVDAVAAEVAFYAPVFRPIVRRFASRNKLSFNVVEAIRANYAPTASLLATIKAVVKHWPRPAAALTAEFRGRINAPGTDEALRVTVQGYSDTANLAGLAFFPNMRVPLGTPIELAHRTGTAQDEAERLGDWSTSMGDYLTPVDVYTSARRLGRQVYAVVSA